MAYPKDLFAVAGTGERCSCSACQVGPQQGHSIVLVPQATIDDWADQLHALPQRKRRSWKGRALDGKGVASRVRFRPEGKWHEPGCSYFEEYNASVSQWLPIFTYEAVRDSFDSFVLAGPFAEITDQAMRRGDLEGLRRLYTARTSHKSRRNRWIPVPTAPGEPTRG